MKIALVPPAEMALLALYCITPLHMKPRPPTVRPYIAYVFHPEMK